MWMHQAGHMQGPLGFLEGSQPLGHMVEYEPAYIMPRPLILFARVANAENNFHGRYEITDWLHGKCKGIHWQRMITQ